MSGLHEEDEDLAIRGEIESSSVPELVRSLLGSGEQRTAPEGFELIEATNPNSGRSFVAYRATDGSDGWYAADLLEKAQKLVERQRQEPEAVSDADIDNIFGDVELVRFAFTVLGD